MAKEIERKYLVADSSYRDMATRSHEIRQGYLARMSADGTVTATVRVRRRDDRAYLTIKGPDSGIVRDEWEYPIAAADADAMLERLATGNIIEKTRYIVPFEGYEWEVDEFHGRLEGLVIAEVELPSADTCAPLPPWILTEVTGDAHYYNSALSNR